MHVKFNMSANWTDSEILLLIDSWSEEGIREQLEGSRCNKHVYEKLSRSLAEHNIKKTGEQCRTKVKKLRQVYKKIKDNHNLMGRGRTQCKFFEKLDKFWVHDLQLTLQYNWRHWIHNLAFNLASKCHLNYYSSS